MGRVIMNGPPPDRGYCLACLMTAKQRQWEQYQDEIQAGYAVSGDKLVVIPWPDALTKEILAGDYRAVAYDFSSVGVVDGLCWGHVAGINPTESPASTLDTSAGLGPQHRRRSR